MTLPHLPPSLQTLTFGADFNQSLEAVTLPASLRTLTVGSAFNQSLKGVIFPDLLEELSLGSGFEQVLEVGGSPSSLRSLVWPNAVLSCR